MSEYEKEQWRQPTVLESDTIIFSEHGRIANNVDFRSHWLLLVKAQYGGYFLLVKHGGGEERIALGYNHVCNALDALGQLTEDQRYLILYCLYATHKNAKCDTLRDTTSYFHLAFLEGRLKRRKRDHRIYCEVRPQAKEVAT